MGGDRASTEPDRGLSRRRLLRRALPWGVGLTVAGILGTGSTYAVGGWLWGWGRKPPPPWKMPLPTPILGAHRGGAGVFPENTLTAFASSYERFGCRFLDVDVQWSQEGVPVVIHDATVDRTTDGTGPVAAHTLAELERLDAGFRFQDPGGVSWAGRGLRIPTLAEVLGRFPDCVFSVELKRGEPDAVAAAVAAIHQTGMAQRVLVGSASEATWLRIQEIAPEIPSFFSFRSGALLLLAVRLGLTRWVLPAHNALLIPRRLFGMDYLDAGTCRAAHDLGLPILVWTVNDPADLERLVEVGVDGILTDRPDLMAGILKRRRAAA